MFARVKQFARDFETREIGLAVFTGLVVSEVRHGLQHHWKSWDSIGDFLLSWLIHTLGLGVLTLAAGAAIIFSHRFFLGYSKEEYGRELTFYIVMTVLVGALAVGVLVDR